MRTKRSLSRASLRPAGNSCGSLIVLLGMATHALVESVRHSACGHTVPSARSPPFKLVQLLIELAVAEEDKAPVFSGFTLIQGRIAIEAVPRPYQLPLRWAVQFPAPLGLHLDEDLPCTPVHLAC